MINDPKWRTIARASKQKIGDVVAVYVHMMTCASNATERGRTEGWSDEDVATALDIKTEDVTAIREAMQGRVLDDDRLTGWEKRQPIREDDSAAARAKAWREAKKAEKQQEEQEQTPPNASKRKETLEEIRRDKDKEPDKEQKPKADARGSRLPADWKPEIHEIEFCQKTRPDLEVVEVANRFRDFWVAQPGAKGRKADWVATWRNWIRNEKQGNRRTPTTTPSRHSGFDLIDYSQGVEDGKII
jgi:hypothetical protein